MYGTDIFTEPTSDPNTLGNLGPLTPMAGSWEGPHGVDVHPVAEGTEEDIYSERYELVPIDAQTNGPQLFYGLRYHTRIVKVGEVETFHDQVGYWLWEPARSIVILTIAIPRAQVLMASGSVAGDATEFELTATIGSEQFGILTNPFLDRSFHTVAFRMQIRIGSDGTWSYEEATSLRVEGRPGIFDHTDRNTLRRVAGPVLNPLAAQSSP